MSTDMDDSFRGRVEKVFGSLASSGSSPLQSKSSLWSITDDEVERREWRRCPDTSARDEMPCSSSFDELLKKDRGISRRRNLDEDDLQRLHGREEYRYSRGQDGRDEWSIRSSIGLDRTLDYEEEEDEYDKVASGRENVGDRLYMSDVTETGSYLNSHNVLGNGNKKDPRANHLAAKFRLKEDEAAAEAQKLSSTLACAAAQVKEPDAIASNDDARPKPILKRKDNEAVFKSQKRVRFNVDWENDCEETCPRNATVSDSASLLANKSSGVPDYLVNPSKYTCYSFASTSEVDEVSKSLDGESRSDMENAFAELPKSVTFIPKKKKSDDDGDEVKQKKEGDRRPSLNEAVAFPVGIAAGEVQGEIRGVEEDEPQTKTADKVAAFGRRYRTMSRSDGSDY